MLAIGLGVFALVGGARLLLAWLNLRHHQLHGQEVPPELAGEIDAEQLAKINAYTIERLRFGLVRSGLGQLLIVAFLFGGLLGWYDAWIAGWALSPVWSGVAFFSGLSLLAAALEVPFDLWGDFRVEARHGFNRKTAGLWWSDWLKSTLLAVFFTALLSVGALAVVQAAPQLWWLWVSALTAVLGLSLTFLSPYLIEPLFFRMQTLRVEGLEASVRSLTQRAGVEVSRVLTVDASRRSSHSNAYFTGLGRVKRVVLFDTLLAQMSHPQVLAILAHELGHWKKRHILSRMLVMQLLTVFTLYLMFRLVPQSWVTELVGLGPASFPARVLVLLLLGSCCAFPLTPLFSLWSRQHEREADSFAVKLHGDPADLADALSKLGRENLSSLHPHPLYAVFYYSHPPLASRIRGLRALALTAPQPVGVVH